MDMRHVEGMLAIGVRGGGCKGYDMRGEHGG